VSAELPGAKAPEAQVREYDEPADDVQPKERKEDTAWLWMGAPLHELLV
jgi:hypothetical protein